MKPRPIIETQIRAQNSRVRRFDTSLRIHERPRRGAEDHGAYETWSAASQRPPFESEDRGVRARRGRSSLVRSADLQLDPRAGSVARWCALALTAPVSLPILG